MTILARFGFLLPYDVINYTLPFTQLHYGKYMLGNLAIIPVSIPYKYIGVMAEEIYELSKDGDASIEVIIYLTFGTLIILTILSIVMFFSRKEIKKVLKEEDEEKLKRRSLRKLASRRNNQSLPSDQSGAFEALEIN